MVLVIGNLGGPSSRFPALLSSVVSEADRVDRFSAFSKGEVLFGSKVLGTRDLSTVGLGIRGIWDLSMGEASGSGS